MKRDEQSYFILRTLVVRVRPTFLNRLSCSLSRDIRLSTFFFVCFCPVHSEQRVHADSSPPGVQHRTDRPPHPLLWRAARGAQGHRRPLHGHHGRGQQDPPGHAARRHARREPPQHHHPRGLRRRPAQPEDTIRAGKRKSQKTKQKCCLLEKRLDYGTADCKYESETDPVSCFTSTIS